MMQIGKQTHIVTTFIPAKMYNLVYYRFLSKGYRRALEHTQPDVVVFLGDLLDEGSSASDQEYDLYASRFHSIFKAPDHVQVSVNAELYIVTSLPSFLPYLTCSMLVC